jgi:hypothetical protein
VDFNYRELGADGRDGLRRFGFVHNDKDIHLEPAWAMMAREPLALRM